MALLDSRKASGRIATLLTTAFISVAVSTVSVSAKDACAQTLTTDTVSNTTGYSDLDDLLLASAYARFMQEQERDPGALIAILNTSEETGIDFDLLLVKAVIESQIGKYDKPIGVNGGARGLYQFLPPTWLTLFSWFGATYNNGQYADLARHIEFDRKNVPYVLDKDIEKQILALRSDHRVAAFIKAMQIKNEEGPFLQKLLGRDPTITDYYIVHFLGIPRATKFYHYLEDKPNKPAANYFRREAKYNKSVFYQHHKKLTFQQVYDRLDHIIQERMKDIRETSKKILEETTCLPPLQRLTPAAPLPPAFDI